MTIRKRSQLLRILHRPARRAKTKKSGAVTRVEGESSNAIVRTPAELVRPAVKPVHVPGRKAKDQSEFLSALSARCVYSL